MQSEYRCTEHNTFRRASTYVRAVNVGRSVDHSNAMFHLSGVHEVNICVTLMINEAAIAKID